MLRRVPVLVAVGVAVGLLLTGCTPHDSTGLVSATVSADAGTEPYEVEVTVDATHKVSERQRVFPGERADFAGVPLGDVTVRAGDLCPEHTTVANGATARVTLTPPPCTGS